MGKITGWWKGKNTKNSWVNEDARVGYVKIYQAKTFYENEPGKLMWHLNRVGPSIRATSLGRAFDTKKEAERFAVRWMRAHPRG